MLGLIKNIKKKLLGYKKNKILTFSSKIKIKLNQENKSIV